MARRGRCRARPDRLAVAGDGSIAVTQSQDHAVRFFSTTGAPLGSVGRQGSGPGEFQGVGRMGWLEDTLWISDSRLNRFVLVAPNRAFIRTINIPGRTRGGENGPTYSWLVANALYLDKSMLATGQNEESTSLIHMTLDGDLVRVVAHVRMAADAHSATTSAGVVTTSLFSDGPKQAVFADGRFAAIARTTFEGPQGSTFSIAVMNRDADTIFARTYPFEGVPIPKSVVDSLIAERLTVIRQSVPALADAFRKNVYAPPVYPPIEGLVMVDDGSVWVAMRVTDQGTPYLVFDNTGEMLGIVHVQANTTVVAVKGSSVYALERDEDDVQSVVRYRSQGS